MSTANSTKITVKSVVSAPVEKVWKCWTDPAHIIQWNNASDDWHTPSAKNDVRTGGKFLVRMEAKDGSSGFDFKGVYDDVKTNEIIAYTMDDGRKVKITFERVGHTTKVTETFDAETQNSVELQRSGWQAIMDNFKKYTESYRGLEVLKFEISIQAAAKKTYETMLKKETYDQWTAIFAPGSSFTGSWTKGSKIVFGAPDENGVTGGMVSRIKENIPGKFVSIEHLGVVQNGKEITSGPDVEPWAGAEENYTFNENNGTTLLSVSMESNEEYKKYFCETWPKALSKLKELAEA